MVVPLLEFEETQEVAAPKQIQGALAVVDSLDIENLAEVD